MPDITIRAMGVKGVNVDADPLLLDDAELRDAQNLFHDHSDGRGGGIRNRRGFTQFVTDPLGGSILGGIGMAVKGTARATGAGPGGTGGTGPGDGDPPGDPDPTGPTGDPSGPFDPSGVFGGARLIVIGRSSGASSTRYGTSWFVTSENLANTALINTGPPGPPNNYGQNPDVGPNDLRAGAPMAGAVFNDYLYYWGGVTSITGNQRPQIRRTNGKIDELVVTVPRDPRTTGTSQQLLSFLSNGDDIYITETTNKNTSATGTSAFSRVFKLSPNNGNALVECPIPTIAPASGAIFYSLAEHNGRIIVGEFTNSVSGQAALYPIVPTASGAVEDTAYGSLSFGSPERGIGCMQNYDARLFVGTSLGPTTGGNFAHIYEVGLGATGGWTGSSVLTGSGGTGAAGNYFPSMCVFNSKLYASYWNPVTATGTSVIYQYDGTTWTGVYTNTGASDLRPFFLFVDKNTMYAVGGATSIGTGSICFLTTTDGTTWVNKTTGVAAITAGILATPLLYGFEQK